MKLKSGFFTLTIIVFMCMSVVFSDRIRLDFRTSLERCLFIVVPSLYIFMILSCMLVSSGTCRLLGIPFRKFSENVLHIPSELFGIFVISLVGYHGELPADYEALIKLKGIGHYTAGAIASIAFGIPVPAVDGNVLRVISRVTEDDADIMKASVRTAMEKDLLEIMPENRDPSSFLPS